MTRFDPSARAQPSNGGGEVSPLQGELTRRKMLQRTGFALLGGAVLSTVGATRTTEASDDQTSAALNVASAAGAQEVRRGGTLRFGNVGGFTSLEGQTIGGAGTYDHLFSVWDRLIMIDADQQPQPMLAESWEISPDYRDFTFHVRRGVQFHTGRELTSADVKWSLERIQDPKIGSVLTGRMTLVTGIDAPDDYTVVVHASRPWVEAFDLLEQATIIDPVTFQSEGLNRPTGTGPFVFAEYLQGDHLRLIRNENY